MTAGDLAGVNSPLSSQASLLVPLHTEIRMTVATAPLPTWFEPDRFPRRSCLNAILNASGLC